MPALIATEKNGNYVVKCTGEGECRRKDILYKEAKHADGEVGHCYHGLEIDKEFFDSGVALERCANRKSFVYAGEEVQTVVRRNNGEKGGSMLKGNPKGVHIFK